MRTAPGAKRAVTSSPGALSAKPRTSNPHATFDTVAGANAVTDSMAALILTARGESLAAFDGRCIPAGCVAPRSNTPGILGRRALPAGRLARLGATPDFHHGLLTGSLAGPEGPPLRGATSLPLFRRVPLSPTRCVVRQALACDVAQRLKDPRAGFGVQPAILSKVQQAWHGGATLLRAEHAGLRQ